VPTEKLVERGDQQALSVDRFGHVGGFDAYVSVRTTSDLGNAANHDSIEQRELNRYIQEGVDPPPPSGSAAEELLPAVGGSSNAEDRTEESPPFTPDSAPMQLQMNDTPAAEFGRNAEFGNWPTTWQEVRLDPLGGTSDDIIEATLRAGEDLGEILLQEKLRTSSLPFAPDGTKVAGFVDTQFSSSSNNNSAVHQSASAPDASTESADGRRIASWEEIAAGGGGGDSSGEEGFEISSSSDVPVVSQRPWTAQGLDAALEGTPGRPASGETKRGGRPQLEIMTREEAEEAYGLKHPAAAAAGGGSRRSSVATQSTIDSEKETSKRLEKELELTMAKLKELTGGPSSNDLTSSKIVLRSASP
jgi:hypothetical protein